MSIESEEPYLFRRGGHEADKFYASFISSSSTSPLSLAFQFEFPGSSISSASWLVQKYTDMLDMAHTDTPP